MKFKLKNASKCMLVFILFAGLLTALHFYLITIGMLPPGFKVHILLLALSFIVMISLCLFYIYGPKDKLGFVFLGFVVFKMFGIGYLAVFEPVFKAYLIPYFILFWLYLLAESVAAVWLIRKQDINHKNN